MKIIVVGHSYVTPFAQEKYVAMKAADPTISIRLIVPDQIRHTFMTYAAERHPDLHAEEYVVARSFGGRTHMTYVLDPVRLYKAIRDFSPDVILIEEDPHSLVGAEVSSLARVASSSSSISWFIWDNLARRPRFPLNMIKYFLTWLAFRSASLVICGNEEGRSLLGPAKGYFGPSVVLPQVGIADAGHRAAHPRNVPPLIGFVGRLVPEKGITLLFEALCQLEDIPWRLIVVGAGPLAESLRAEWLPRLEGRVILCGAVSHSKVPEILESLDIFVLPSCATPLWKEQFGLTLVQAMMAGVACVGSSSGSIPDVLGNAGVIFPEGDCQALADVLRDLLESEDRRQAAGSAGRRRALEYFSTRAVANRYLTALTGLVNDAN